MFLRPITIPPTISKFLKMNFFEPPPNQNVSFGSFPETFLRRSALLPKTHRFANDDIFSELGECLEDI